MARRYGPNGTFWAENPLIPRHPITAYQIWNEPNLRAYWPSGQNAKSYAKLLKAAANGIRSVDPYANIVTAGLPDSSLSKPLNVYDYVKALLKAKAASSFNTLALNPYSKNKKDLLAKLNKFRDDPERRAREQGKPLDHRARLVRQRPGQPVPRGHQRPGGADRLRLPGACRRVQEAPAARRRLLRVARRSALSAAVQGLLGPPHGPPQPDRRR